MLYIYVPCRIKVWVMKLAVPTNTKSNDEEAQLMQVEWCESLREIKQCHEG
jgi:hypothetical protein